MRGGARSLRMARPLLSPAASETEVGTDAVGALSTSGTSAESRMAHRVPRPEHECRRVRVRRFVSLSVRICSPQAPHSVAALVAECGEFHIGPAKSRIAFLGQVRFGDKIGYLPVSQTGAMLFFQLINRRYERASTVLTSNKGFEEWGQILGDDVMAAALIDRLLHHCHIVNIRGSSYRMRKHTDLSKILHSPPAQSSPSPPKRKRARAKEKTTN